MNKHKVFNASKCSTEIVNCSTKSTDQSVIGELYLSQHFKKSYLGYESSILKSGIQKYARRAEIGKGLWCLVEMDQFSLLERDGPALNAYLLKYPKAKRANTQKLAKGIRTNMVNRLVAMVSEEISISAWWMPSKIFELYQKWMENRGNASSRKYLVDMYLYLTSQKMIRLISDLKSVFPLPPYSVDPDHMTDLIRIHYKVRKQYPGVYSNEAEVGKVKWEPQMDNYPPEVRSCIAGITYNIEQGSDNVFYWISRLCDFERKDWVVNKNGKNKYDYKYRNLKIVWKILHRFIEENSKYAFVNKPICALEEFYNRMTHTEKSIYLYHAVLLIVRRKEIDWSSKPPLFDTPIDDVEKLYRQHLGDGIMKIDGYVMDMHTKGGKKSANCLENFALEGAYVKNINDNFLHKEYREIYILLKKELDLILSRGKKSKINPSDLRILARKVGVPIQKLSAETMAKVYSAPQGQKRTSKYKKAVKIVNDLVFKGPYTSDKDIIRLMKNLKYTYALELLESILQLAESQKGSLRWEYVGCWKDNQYYLVGPNVGKRENIPFELKTTKIETNVQVVPSGGHVSQVSEIEGSALLTDEIKLASLQHLYLRFLFDIGDSGTLNILIRKDYEHTGRLIAGIDLEEKRGIKVKESQLAHLFKKGPSKEQNDLYESDIFKIRSLSYCELDQQTLGKLKTVGINLVRLKENMNLWERLK